MRRLLLLALTGLTITGCGSSTVANTTVSPSPSPLTCSQIYSLLQLRPSDTADLDSHGQCIPQNLQVSGEVSGLIQIAALQTRPDKSCAAGVLGAPFVDMPNWDVVVAGKLYTLRLRPTARYTGQQTTIQTDVKGAVELVAKEGDFDYRATAGRLAVDVSGYRGTVDVDLARDAAGSSPVHIKGDWSCGTPPASPSPITGTPCSSYFAAASTPGVDPSSLPCLGQDLTFTGALSTHVTEAVIIPSGTQPSCGGLTAGDQQNYGAIESFAASGKPYDLAFSTHQDPVQGPLQFPVGPTYQPPSGGTKPTLMLTTGAVSWSSTSGKFSLSSDGKSGMVDMVLVGGLSGSETVHVSGSWRCGQ